MSNAQMRKLAYEIIKKAETPVDAGTGQHSAVQSALANMGYELAQMVISVPIDEPSS